MGLRSPDLRSVHFCMHHFSFVCHALCLGAWLIFRVEAGAHTGVGDMKPVVSVSIMFAFFLTIRPCLTIIDALGPSDYCSDGNCLYEDDESYKSFVDTYGESSGDFHEEVSEKEVDEDELLFDDEDVSDGDKSTDDVAKRHDSFMDNFRKPLKYIWRATKKVANDAYNATVETLQDVGEILRTVLNEEAYNMFFSAAETLQANVATTGII